MKLPGAKSMAIGTDHIALGGLGEDQRATLQGGATGTKREGLRGPITVVEVHLVAREATAAVRAGDLSKLAEERRRGVLAPTDPLDFLLAIGGVVGPVERSLVAFGRHDSG